MASRLGNDLKCVEWDVTVPLLRRSTLFSVVETGTN